MNLGHSFDHTRLRKSLKAAKTIEDFTSHENYDNGVCKCLKALREGSVGKDTDTFNNMFGEAFREEKKWATTLHAHRRTVTVFLFTLADRWSDGSVSAEEMKNAFERSNVIAEMCHYTALMDRAVCHAGHHNIKEKTYGYDWFAEEDWHQKVSNRLEISQDDVDKHTIKPLIPKARELGVENLVRAGRHHINKRYLWFLYAEELKPLGVDEDDEIVAALTPQLAPRRSVKPPPETT